MSSVHIIQPSVLCLGAAYWKRMWAEIARQTVPGIQWVITEDITLAHDQWEQKNVLMRIHQDKETCVLEDWIAQKIYDLPEFFSVFLGDLKQLESAKGYKAPFFAFYQSTLITDDHGCCALREKESEILEHCLLHYEMPIHKDVLLSEIWQYGEDIETFTLETHIAQLNKKLGLCRHRIVRDDKNYTLCSV